MILLHVLLLLGPCYTTETPVSMYHWQGGFTQQSPPRYLNQAQKFNHPTHYKLWTEEKIWLACDAVRVDGYTYRRAELECGVPKSTIRDRISGRTLPGATSGPERYLTEEEEKELTHFIKECAKVGYAKTRKQIIAIVPGCER